MRKNFLLKGVAAITVLASFTQSVPAFAAPPVYRSNVLDEVMITRIIPSETYLELTYNRLGTRGENEIPVYSNIQYGEITDYQLHNLESGVYAGSTVVARGHHSAQYFWPSFDDGETRPLMKGKPIKSNVNLLNNTSNRLHYVVVYASERQRSRVDYNRCVLSEAFRSGLATECRMEIKGNGLVQYQPYTSDGVRMELSPEEDALLTEATESWRAEPGNWGPEWYIEPTEPTPGDDGGSEGGDTGDTDGGGAGDTGDDAGGDTSGTGGGTDGGDTGGTDGGDAGDTGSGTDSTGGDVGNTGDDTGGGDAVDTGEASSMQIAFTFTSAGGASGFAYWTPGETGNSGGSLIADNTDVNSVTDTQGGTSDGGQGSESENKNEATDNSGSSDNVGVPSLGQEEGSKLNWPAVFAIPGLAAAGLAGWWFLFFGKNNLRKKKGEKK